MKQVININFQGRVVPIETSAYEILKLYIESLSRHFAAEEGKDEIINDIENRIGELFQERLKDGATCITEDDVNAIIRSMGRPEDFETEETSSAPGASAQQENNNAGNTHTAFTAVTGKRLYRDENHKLLGGVCSGVANYFNIDVVIVRVVFLILLFTFGFGIVTYIILWVAVPSSASVEIGSLRKKMYRDTDDKWIGGVCSGLAHYFGINVWIPRLLFLLPFLTFVGRWGHWGRFGDFPNFISLSFSPGSMILYIILWLVLPEAVTTAEKLEMKGEKVDMNSIKNSVMEEMKGVQERAHKFGKDAATIAGEKGRAFGTEAGSAVRRGSRSLGDVIVFLIKLFGYFILGCICFALVVALFVGGFWAIGYFPMKDFVLKGGTQNFLAWGTLLFFIVAPMIGVITWIVRRLAKIRKGSKLLRLGFIAMWIAGWIFVSFLFASLSKDFRQSSQIIEQNVALSNPAVNSLEVTTVAPGQQYSRNNFSDFNPFDNADEDTAFIRNTEVHIARSSNDSFRVTITRLARGYKQNYADTLAALINYNVVQKDSSLVIDKAIAINKKDKFRNQHVILTIYVPVGKRIYVDQNVGWSNDIRFEGPWIHDREDIQFEHIEHGWGEGEWYTMTKDGLFTQDGKRADRYRAEQDDNGDSDDGSQEVIINNNGIKIRVDKDKTTGIYRYDSAHPVDKFDSLKINILNEEKKYKDSLKKEKDKIDKLLNKDNKDDNGTAFTSVSNDPTIFLN